MTEESQEQKEDQFKEQLDELLINVRNEVIVQTANLYLLGRQVFLAGLGMGALTVESAQAFVQRAAERGEIAEADAQVMLERFREDGLVRASEAEATAPSLTDRAAVALADSASTILRVLHLHSTNQ